VFVDILLMQYFLTGSGMQKPRQVEVNLQLDQVTPPATGSRQQAAAAAATATAAASSRQQAAGSRQHRHQHQHQQQQMAHQLVATDMTSTGSCCKQS
jgi:hypothetical protein